MKGLKFNQYYIKIFMALLMVTDHLHYVPELISPSLEAVFHVLTRCVAVWFGYCAVEGFLYTKNIKKYLIRLYAAAVIMFAGNWLIGFLFASKQIVIANNIFLTLALGVSTLAAFKYIKSRPLAYICSVIIFMLGLLFTEGGFTVLPFMMISYFAYKKHTIRNICYLLLSAILFATSYVSYATFAETISMLAYNSDFMFILIIPVLYMYNGEHGPHTKFSKSFFYVFYPAHLWILALAAYLVS